jgi:hypothetical protein
MISFYYLSKKRHGVLCVGHESNCVVKVEPILLQSSLYFALAVHCRFSVTMLGTAQSQGDQLPITVDIMQCNCHSQECRPFDGRPMTACQCEPLTSHHKLNNFYDETVYTS